MIQQLFPDLAYEYDDWGHLNVTEVTSELADLIGFRHAEFNPWLDRKFLSKWLRFICNQRGIKYTWGGYLENREELWRGMYMKPGQAIHLGIDVRVPQNTEVVMPTWGVLRHSFQDPDQNGGWGGKLIFEVKDQYLVLGHLQGIPDDIGAKYSPGHKIGTIAGPETNGGWGSHLHIQLMREFIPDIDGYGPAYEGMEKDFLDPVEWI